RNGSRDGISAANASFVGFSSYVINFRAGSGYHSSATDFSFNHMTARGAANVFLLMDGQFAYGTTSVNNLLNTTAVSSWTGLSVDLNCVIGSIDLNQPTGNGVGAFRHAGKGYSKTLNVLYLDGHSEPVRRDQMVSSNTTDVGTRSVGAAYNQGPPWLPYGGSKNLW
ncbi:MAG: hypothetical protein JWM57_1065, partial [Phycisphaerales bacterium]|nr:hypothetical protein [Phycisphaerales bacterium]